MSKRIQPFTTELSLIDAASDGIALGRHEGRVVFVAGGVPGDVAQVHVRSKEKNALVADLVEVITPSADRTTPECAHFGVCGGCKWQMMTYEAQLRYKQKQVTDALERIGKVEIGETRPILGVETPYWYRNKLEFTYSAKRWLTREEIRTGAEYEQRVLGFHAPQSFEKVIHIDECHLQLPIVNAIRNEAYRFAIENGISFHDQVAHKGFLRNLMFRTSIATNELMLTLIVNDDKPALVGEIFEHLAAKFPEITDFVWIVNNKLNSQYSDLPVRVWRGKAHITEYLGGFAFRISPTSFFQTNPKQAEVLYGVVRHFLKEISAEFKANGRTIGTLYDLYCGTGSIGIYVSDWAQKIVGIDYVASAIEDAKLNAQLNNLNHLSFFAGDMKKVLTDDFTAQHGAPDVVIADPARSGMDPQVVTQLLKLAPQHIIYVSCKPSTQARDLQLLDGSYRVAAIQPVDMFPHTAHVENVAWLVRR